MEMVVGLGVVAAAAASAALAGGLAVASLRIYKKLKPKDPAFEVLSVQLNGFHLHFSNPTMPSVDADLTLRIKVINPNVAPIEYSATTMDMFYADDLLGHALVESGSQGANDADVIEVPAKISGLKITKNLGSLLSDVRKREMNLVSVVTIKGHARLWRWTHKFQVHVKSDVKIDPVFLDVIEQDNKEKNEVNLLTS